MESRKIAILCNYQLLPERIGGMDYFFWDFNKKCKENGIDVDWFFPNHGMHEHYPNLTIYSNENQSVENNFLVFCKQNQTEYSHIITHFIELCTPFFQKLKKISNAIVIAVDHNPRPLNGYSFKKKINKRVKGGLFSRYIDVFIGVSEYSKKELIKDFGYYIKDRISVIPNGLDFSKFKQKTSFNSNNKFIVACHLRKEKGIQDLITVVNEIHKKHNFVFSIDIYGDGYYKDELNKMIRHFSLQDVFNFKGSVSNLSEVYCNYDYLIHPSHGETFCYTVLESLVCNLPVITTQNEGNVLGLVKENQNGFLFEASKTDQLKKILLNIFNQNLILENKSVINDNLQTFSLTKMVDNYFELI
ncbi:glycosyltransferase family 4 protein [Flavobacterium sp. MDT1-60]|uniref:glycosyltransferase family 4 protein n=1 Tax=Flavobacterium sp. MDT1-60 TaxID=1979344 RepID=UPI00177F1865|nr:glycosyltransferase family 4 protein [Flavobacterium sp. MDT1-60]QOG03821.1 glycosyltransferase family 4 protein [Flavobacterium sp. MDT1-60]